MAVLALKTLVRAVMVCRCYAAHFVKPHTWGNPRTLEVFLLCDADKMILRSTIICASHLLHLVILSFLLVDIHDDDIDMRFRQDRYVFCVW